MLIRSRSFVFRLMPALASLAISFSPLLAVDEAVPVPAVAPATATPESGPLPGHSSHGEVFSEGPRQKAYLMQGMAKVNFPVTSDKPEVQAFINQGVSQLHGFWYLESERSFRQAAAIDPDCAIAYWGMAMSNLRNAKRAKVFIHEAVKRKDKASKREQMYIDALAAYHNASDAKDRDKARKQTYIEALEEIIEAFPEDIEVKAFLAFYLWEWRSAVPSASTRSVDAIIQQVLDVEPMHPVHHYRIHLWDYRKASVALPAAARCGQSAPGIAHMWHMSGHIYDKTNRFHDAAWQQEASARVDHAHMMRDRVLPDQIFNYAHNNEWLVRTLMTIGRADDAAALAANMIELPRHPKFNVLSKENSGTLGRRRLLEVYERFEMWDELLTETEKEITDSALATDALREGDRIVTADGKPVTDLTDVLINTALSKDPNAKLVVERNVDGEKKTLTVLNERRVAPYLAPLNETEEIRNLRLRGIAFISKQNIDEFERIVTDLTTRHADKMQKRDEAVAAAQEKATKEKKDEKATNKAKDDARKPFNDSITKLENALAELRGHKALHDKQNDEAIRHFELAKDTPKARIAYAYLAAGNAAKAEEIARAEVKARKWNTLNHALLIDVLWKAGKKPEAIAAFNEFKPLSSEVDLTAPAFARLKPVATELKLPDDWRAPQEFAKDLIERPTLDSLGPFRWQPTPAQSWTLPDAQNHPISLSDYAGKPVIVIFYLGAGCVHCNEQLAAFNPMTQQFADAGISIIAISTDEISKLKDSLKPDAEGKPFPFPIVSDAKLETFKAYRAFDDFENQPLHGTFLIDSAGLVRWHDTGFAPFMDAKFLLGEAKRLLAMPVKK